MWATMAVLDGHLDEIANNKKIGSGGMMQEARRWMVRCWIWEFWIR